MTISREVLQKPSWSHPFGTDTIGRDVFKRCMYGGVYSIGIGIVSTLIGLGLGLILGLVAAMSNKFFDSFIMRINEVFYSIPQILIATIIVSLFGPGFVKLLLALSISSVIAFTRIVRAQAIKLKSSLFVESEIVLGMPMFKIALVDIVPNIMNYLIVQFSISSAGAILSASSLSFLGIGIPLPIPEWGAMLSEGYKYIRVAPHLSIFPGLLISLSVLSLNLVGDGLRDAM